MPRRKTRQSEIENKRGLFFQIGLASSLALVLLAFEWKFYVRPDYDLGELQVMDRPEEIIPLTKRQEKKPPPPPATPVEIRIVEDNVEIEQELKIENTEVTQETRVEVYEVVEVQEEVVDEPEIFTIVEDMPKFPGGETALLKYLGGNIHYPAMARQNNIQGIVFVTFEVDRHGYVKDARILRGIGGGCDEEALRVVQEMPRWKAGRQRDKPVRVQFNLPVRFTLRN